jgi:5-methylcytosine-specific restriction endonuclease McrA
MSCTVCGNNLTGRQLEACSRSCRIKLDGIKRRGAGRLRKANMAADQYARKLKRNKADADKRRAQGRDKITWGCVTCSKRFKVKRYSESGYWCSQKCRSVWLSRTRKRKTKAYPADWIDPPTRYAIYHRDRWTCHLCHLPVPPDLEWVNDEWQPNYPTLDHLVPRSHGGTDEPSNLKLAHMGCNTARGNAPLIYSTTF